MIIDVAELGGGSELGGSLRGRRVFEKFIERVAVRPIEPTVVFLDLNDVQIATASFLRDSLFAFKNEMRAHRSTVYPVFANPNEVVLEEITVVANATSDVAITCRLSRKRQVTDVRLTGELDAKQRMTFDAVVDRREADAATLMSTFGAQEKTTRTTAWNNRLAALAARGVVMEFASGRAKTYRPLFERVS